MRIVDDAADALVGMGARALAGDGGECSRRWRWLGKKRAWASQNLRCGDDGS